MKNLKIWSVSFLVAAAAAAAACAPPAMAAPHAHEAGAPSKLALDQGRKWGTDAPLRSGMTSIRDLTEGGIALAHAGRMDAKQYAALAGKVEQEVGGIVASCKLEPRADAMLHLVIADIGAATGAMAGKAPGTRPEAGLLQLARAVNDYGRHFDHPGFRAVQAGH